MAEFKLKPAEAQALWVEALLSGEYQQGHGQLCQVNNARDTLKFCCLGVLTDLFINHEGVGEWYQDGNNLAYSEYEAGIYQSSLLPLPIREWAGLTSVTGEFLDPASRLRSLAHLNDRGASFERIAEVIKSRPVGLFVEGD